MKKVEELKRRLERVRREKERLMLEEARLIRLILFEKRKAGVRW